jgi:osmoprotectant transport system permease protein
MDPTGARRIMSGLHHLLVWFNDPANWQGQDGVTHRVAEHLLLWAKAMVIAVAIAVPGGLLLGRSRRSGTFTLNVANIGRAIPSFAVLVLGVIWFGLSDVPVVVALVLLAIPPIFTFTFTGVRGVDRGVVESARGMGMSEPRVLRSVQVPLASPLVLNGIRLSSAAVLATVPLAALIGSGGLGRYVIDGFAARDYTEVGAGVVIVVALVVLNELLFAALIARVTPGPRGRRRRLRMPRPVNT